MRFALEKQLRTTVAGQTQTLDVGLLFCWLGAAPALQGNQGRKEGSEYAPVSVF